jgi:hypothetical protein
MTLQINTFNKSLRLHQGTEPLETPIDRTQKELSMTNNWGYTYYRYKDNRTRGVTTLSMDHEPWFMVQDRITERNI